MAFAPPSLNSSFRRHATSATPISSASSFVGRPLFASLPNLRSSFRLNPVARPSSTPNHYQLPPLHSAPPVRSVVSSLVLTPTLLIIVGGAVAFCLSAALGANDVANSLGTSVGTGAIKIRTALCIGAVMEFAGAVLFGSTVTKTISSGVVSISAATLAAPVSYMLGMCSVLVGCTVWMAVATKWGLPVSSTHSVVGALIGLGVVSGWGIHMAAVQRIVASWFLSPLIGGIFATTLYRAINTFIKEAHRPAQATRRFLPVLAGGSSFVLTLFILGKGARFALSPDRVMAIAMAISLACTGLAGALASTIHSKQYTLRKFGISGDGALAAGGGGGGVGLGSPGAEIMIPRSEQQEDVERIFKVLQAVTACLLAFSHGSNDVSNAIGPFAAMYTMWRNASVGSFVAIPIWILVLGGAGISTGLGLFGRPVMETVGKKITTLKPTMGFSVELSTALTVLVASELGLPVSTTHTLIGCIVAIGLTTGKSDAINKGVLRNIAGSWGVTLPFSALATVIFYLALRPLLPIAPAIL